MKRFKVGLIGLGNMGKNHARILRSLPEVDFIGAVDSALESHSSDIPLFSSLDELLNSKPDYCVISTPTNSHEHLAINLANHGIGFLIEKPIAMNYESAIRIEKAAIKNHVIAGVGHIERFNSAIIEAKRRITWGEIGMIYQISTRRLGPFPVRITDVGVTLDLASHDIDLSKWLADSDYNSITALTLSKSDTAHEDLLTAVGEMKNGIVISHNVNWLSPLKERKTVITGEKGTFVVDTLGETLTFYQNGSIPNLQNHLAHFQGATQGQTIKLAFERPEALYVEHVEFIKAMHGQDSHTVTLQESAETVKVSESILRSAELRATVML
jgi:UDP-N-acetylglucosamine 3-dehydrogenase